MTLVNRCSRCKRVRYPGFMKKGKRTLVWLDMGAFRDEVPESIAGNHVCDDCRAQVTEPKKTLKPWERIPPAPVKKILKPWERF